MNAGVLSAAMKLALDAKMTAKIGQPYMELTQDFKDKFLAAIAEAVSETVVSHIQTFALVNSTVAVASVSAVTTGTGVSGPGVGTATGTIL